ncbi:kinesin-like protein KIN-10C isoform X3 [Panicum virgatum]|uniref:Kinesin motor domain-containing protein n=1 Tax=Panicum virgatum TaxID=38727 RepID=A0A8T0MN61_PANVG|nr:kinesin-like protein KIN-10C isoform X3 [Panicum virgatum]KAG2538577.1 hypothetical protein PVAP13_9NG380300 [Panicum virgatum]
MAGAATPSRSAAPSSRPVRVVLRVRLFLPSEATSAAVLCVSLLNSHLGGEVTVQFMGQHTSRGEHYKLDALFSQEDNINQIFDWGVSTVIPGIFEGVNATVFAYGATGSGKTYMMQKCSELRHELPMIFISQAGYFRQLILTSYDTVLIEDYDLSSKVLNFANARSRYKERR